MKLRNPFIVITGIAAGNFLVVDISSAVERTFFQIVAVAVYMLVSHDWSINDRAP